MKELDENTALSIIFANTKRKKRNVDLLTLAESFEFLIKLYGSQNAAAERVNLHSEMIRQFRSLLKLPPEIRSLMSSRQIDKLDVAYRLSMIKDPKQQIDAARAVSDMALSKDVRDVARLVRKSDSSVEDSKKRVIEAKPKGLHIFLMDFDDRMYQSIHRKAKKMGIGPAELVKQIVEEWFKKDKITGEE